MTHEHHSRDVRTGNVVLDIGDDAGVAIFYTDPKLCWQEIEIIPTDTPTTRTHTEVTQRLLAGNIIYTGVFPPLPIGEYRVSRPEMRRNERFSIAAGHVTQIDWRSQS